MLAYILVSKRPVPTGSLRGHPGAEQQLVNLSHLAKLRGITNPPTFIYDYAEVFSKLCDLPNLEKALKLAKDHDSFIIIDDFRRLFSRCKTGREVQFYHELFEYGSHFRDLRTSTPLNELPQVGLTQILAAEKPIKFVLATPPKSPRSSLAKKRQTKKATAASLIKRSAKADKKAQEIITLKETLELDGKPITIASLTKAANAQGMTTSRGNPWLSPGVSRALKRAADRKLSEE